MQLCFDLVKDWILDNPKASICTAEGVDEFRDIAIFQDYHGLPEFRKVWNIRKLCIFSLLHINFFQLKSLTQLGCYQNFD